MIRPSGTRGAQTPSTALRTFSFAHCRLDLARRELHVDNERVLLQPRVFDLLSYMVENAGRALGKAELIAAVWPTRFVTEDALAGAVRKLRSALGDRGPGSPVRVSTVFGIGYRLDVAVMAQVSATEPRGLAVLRVINETGDEALDWTEEGLACLLHFRLQRASHLVLMPLVESLACHPRGGLRAASQALGGASVVLCRLRRSGPLLSLVAEVGTDEDEAWARHVEGQDAGALVARMSQALSVVEGEPLPLAPAESGPDAAVGRAEALTQAGRVAQAWEELQAWPADPVVTSLRVRLLRLRGRLGEARSDALAALEARPGNRELNLRAELARLAIHSGEAAAMVERLRELERCLDEAPSSSTSTRAQALALAGGLEVRTTHTSVGWRLADRATRLADKARDPESAVEARLTLGMAWALNWEILTAQSTLDEAIALASRHRLRLLEGRAWYWRASVHRLVGQGGRACAAAQRAVDLLPPASDLPSALAARVLLCQALLAGGDHRELDHHVAAVESLWSQLDDDVPWAEFGMLQAALAWHRGRAADAARWLQKLVEDPRRTGLTTRWQAALWTRHGLVSLAGGRHETEPATRTDGLALSADQRCLLEAQALRLQGRCRDSRRRLHEGLPAARPGGFGQEVRIALAWVLAEDGDTDAAAVLVEDLDALGVEGPRLDLLRHILALREGRVTWDGMQWSARVDALGAGLPLTPTLSDPSRAWACLSGPPAPFSQGLPLDPFAAAS